MSRVRHNWATELNSQGVGLNSGAELWKTVWRFLKKTKNRVAVRSSNSTFGHLFYFSRSVTSDSLQPHGLQHARLPSPSPTPGARSLMSIKSVMPSNHLTVCRPPLLPPSIFPSIWVFFKESVLHIRWLKYWSFSPSNEYSELTFFRIDWLDLLAIQGTLKSFFNTTVQKHQFVSTQTSLWSNSHIHTWLLEKP